MRLFRRSRDTKTSALRREEASATADVEPVLSVAPPSSSVAPVAEPPASSVALLDDSPSPPSYAGHDQSDVYMCASDPEGAATAAREVTLFVHGWYNVEPGLLSWTFPSLRSALDAVRRMKNAIGWCVVSGTGWRDLDTARARGAVLVEQLS